MREGRERDEREKIEDGVAIEIELLKNDGGGFMYLSRVPFENLPSPSIRIRSGARVLVV